LKKNQHLNTQKTIDIYKEKPLIPPRIANLYDKQKDMGSKRQLVTDKDIKIITENGKQKQIILDILSKLPRRHVVDNKELKSIIVTDDNNFLAKHNNKNGNIYLSKKLFTLPYQAKRPFHRIRGVPSLIELLSHEIGHSVEKVSYGTNDNKQWIEKFGWVYPKDNNEVKTLSQRGYSSAMYNFNNISENDRNTLDQKDIQDIEGKIRERYPMQKDKKRNKISWYGLVSPKEDFAESYCNYIFNNKNMFSLGPERYEFIEDEIMDGEVFDS